MLMVVAEYPLAKDDVRACRRTSDVPAPARTPLSAAFAPMADRGTSKPGCGKRAEAAVAGACYDPVRGAPDDT